ncbi:hypothetical protein C3L33_15367, partial [Rhododendron williamsianum]
MDRRTSSRRAGMAKPRRRRRGVGNYIIPIKWQKLNFDAWAITRKIQFPALARETELYHARLDRAKYVSRVNEVLESHRGESAEEIKIIFGLDGSHSRAIDNWVNFAFEKGVKRFELGLHWPLIKGPCLPYDFPRLEKFLGSDAEQEQQSNGHVKRTVRSSGFRSLLTLRLGFVNVAGDTVKQYQESESRRFIAEIETVGDLPMHVVGTLGDFSYKSRVIDMQRAIGIGIQIRDFHKAGSSARSASSLIFQFRWVVGASVHLGSELRFKLCDGGGLWVWAWTEVFADGRSCWFVQVPVVARRRIDGGWFDAICDPWNPPQSSHSLSSLSSYQNPVHGTELLLLGHGSRGLLNRLASTVKRCLYPVGFKPSYPDGVLTINERKEQMDLVGSPRNSPIILEAYD